jgi:hypothetical protein
MELDIDKSLQYLGTYLHVWTADRSHNVHLQTSGTLMLPTPRSVAWVFHVMRLPTKPNLTSLFFRRWSFKIPKVSSGNILVSTMYRLHLAIGCLS